MGKRQVLYPKLLLSMNPCRSFVYIYLCYFWTSYRDTFAWRDITWWTRRRITRWCHVNWTNDDLHMCLRGLLSRLIRYLDIVVNIVSRSEMGKNILAIMRLWLIFHHHSIARLSVANQLRNQFYSIPSLLGFELCCHSQYQCYAYFAFRTEWFIVVCTFYGAHNHHSSHPSSHCMRRTTALTMTWRLFVDRVPCSRRFYQYAFPLRSSVDLWSLLSFWSFQIGKRD